MILWEREGQCKNCFYECGWDEAREISEDGTIFYEHEYDCRLRNLCDTDLSCKDFAEDE